MANTKQKTPLTPEKQNGSVGPAPDAAAAPSATPERAESLAGNGERIALLVWLLGFLFLAVLLLWDLFTALFLR